MDNTLSKPVAWKLHHHDRYYFEENADVVAIAESMGQAKGDAVYSQEYVSAMKHESAVNWEAAASLNVENQELKKRIAELETKLATPAINEVAAERQRQISDENFEVWNDDLYTEGELAVAAGCYALHAHNIANGVHGFTPQNWPWDREWWKPTNPRRDQVKAAALILAEIERIDRAAGFTVKSDI